MGGADGIYSTVRELAVHASSLRHAGQMVWRSIIPTRPGEIVEMIVLMGEGYFCWVVPMGEGYTYGFGAADGRRLKDRVFFTKILTRSPDRDGSRFSYQKAAGLRHRKPVCPQTAKGMNGMALVANLLYVALSDIKIAVGILDPRLTMS